MLIFSKVRLDWQVFKSTRVFVEVGKIRRVGKNAFPSEIWDDDGGRINRSLFHPYRITTKTELNYKLGDRSLRAKSN